VLNNNLYIFEGYDGSGKSTLISKVTAVLHNKTVRVIGRKNEPRLAAISQLIEDPQHPTSEDAEMRLRIALETERLHLISRLRSKFDFVFLDRGPISLRAWVSYYNLDLPKYSLLLEGIEKALQGATMFLCRSDFETCWNRIERKENKSKKELMGKQTNWQWYNKYVSACETFQNEGYRIVQVDTNCSIRQSVDCVISNIAEFI